MTFKITRKTRNLEKLIAKIKAVKRTNVQSGYFSEQGQHPVAGMSYAELMQLHEYGFTSPSGVRVPERPVRFEATQIIKEEKRYRKLISRYLFSKNEWDDVLDDLGRYITETAQSIFGSNLLTANSPYYLTTSNKLQNLPLIFDGYLQNNWSWRTSEAPMIKNLF